jgi:hypothetical protein
MPHTNVAPVLELVSHCCAGARRFEVGQEVDVTECTSGRILVNVQDATEPLDVRRRVVDQRLDDARIEGVWVRCLVESNRRVTPPAYCGVRRRGARAHADRAHDESWTAPPDLGAPPNRQHRPTPLGSSPRISAAVSQRTVGRHAKIVGRSNGGSPCR